MPVIRDIPTRLKDREVLRRQGIGTGGEVRLEIGILVRQLPAAVEKGRLLEPAVAYEICALAGMTQRQLSLDSGLTGYDPLLRLLLSGAKEIAVAVRTIGPGLEKQVTENTDQGEPLQAMLLDGIGSAAVDWRAEEFRGFVANQASSPGCEGDGPINPGMPDLPITAQWRLPELIPPREIGVSLASSGMMIPRKSVSMVTGIGRQMAKWSRAEVCARCSLRETCGYGLTT